MQKQVSGGVTAPFQITPTCYLGLFTNLQLGSIVSSDAAVGPVMIKFPEGKNKVEVEASTQGVNSLSVPMYSYVYGPDVSAPKYS